MRLRSPPPSAGGEEQGDVRLALMMNAVALQSLSTLAALAAAHHPLPSGGGNGRNSNVDLIRAPFAMLADMLEQFPPQNLVRRCVQSHCLVSTPSSDKQFVMRLLVDCFVHCSTNEGKSH